MATSRPSAGPGSERGCHSKPISITPDPSVVAVLGRLDRAAPDTVQVLTGRELQITHRDRLALLGHRAHAASVTGSAG